MMVSLSVSSPEPETIYFMKKLAIFESFVHPNMFSGKVSEQHTSTSNKSFQSFIVKDKKFWNT